MLSNDDIVDLEIEMYKLNGTAKLLEVWSNNCEHFEATIISETLNNTIKNINTILKL